MTIDFKPPKKNRAQRRAERTAGKSARKRPLQAPNAAETSASVRPPELAVSESETSDEPPPEERAADFEASYRSLEGEALALAPGEVASFTANAMVVFQNVRTGTRAVLAERAVFEADREAPKPDFARVVSAITAAEALVYASRRAAGATATKNDLATKTREVFELRDVLLASAVAAIKARVLPPKAADAVAAIQVGRGPIDGAQDCIDLAALFRAHAAALAGKTAVTPELVEKAAACGSALLHLLAPAGVAVASDEPDPIAEAADLRDRMAALVAQKYAYVARVGGWRWGFDLTAHVPPMRSRTVARGEKKPAAEPVAEPTKPA